MATDKAFKAFEFLQGLEAGGEEAARESIAREQLPVPDFETLSDPEKWAVEGAVGKLRAGEPDRMSEDEAFALEAIIIPDRRPVIDVRDDDFDVTHGDWLHLNDPAVKARLRPRLPAIGRVDLPDHPSIPFAGTAFLVGDDLVMTNRHVAEVFMSGLGRGGLAFLPGIAPELDFVEEVGRASARSYRLLDAVLIHPFWDMALFRIEEAPAEVEPLTLSLEETEPAEGAPGVDVVVVGYPAFDPRNPSAVQNRVFNGVYDKKRLQPGKRLARREVGSFGNQVRALTHDASTLGGNSGSAVIDVASGKVVGLHFGGRYLVANYAVPARDLALDARLVDLGLNFDRGASMPAVQSGPWAARWSSLEGPVATPTPAPTPAPSASDSAPVTVVSGPDATSSGGVAGTVATFTIPITITVQAGAPSAGSGLPAPAAAPAAFATEKMVEPWHAPSYADRTGYDPGFLSTAVPLPVPTDPSELATLEDGDHVVPYMHFSLAMHRRRRLALFTAANVRADIAAKQPEPGRTYTRDALGGLGESDVERWFPDPRLRGIEQLPDRFFTKDRKAFDKGHLVRREDVAWGETFEELRIANGDTYHVTNCSPQTAGFNRANQKTNWGELEKAVLAQARTQRLLVFAGPVLADDDPWFAGFDDEGAVRVQIPVAYWKVVAAPAADGIMALGFVLEQDLGGVAMERIGFADKWKSSMLALADLEKRIGRLTFPDALHRADAYRTSAAEAVARWTAPKAQR